MDHEHPEVLPQPSQTKHEPAIRIFTPQVMQSGASDFTPLIFSKSSIDELTPAEASGFAWIVTDALLFTAAGATTGAATFGAATSRSGVYSPESSARARSDAVYKPSALRESNDR